MNALSDLFLFWEGPASSSPADDSQFGPPVIFLGHISFLSPSLFAIRGWKEGDLYYCSLLLLLPILIMLGTCERPATTIYRTGTGSHAMYPRFSSGHRHPRPQSTIDRPMMLHCQASDRATSSSSSSALPSFRLTVPFPPPPPTFPILTWANISRKHCKSTYVMCRYGKQL